MPSVPSGDHDERRDEDVDEAQATEARDPAPAAKIDPKIRRTADGRAIAASHEIGLAEQQLRLGADEREHLVHDSSFAVRADRRPVRAMKASSRRRLVDAQVLGDDPVAGQDGGHGGEQVAGAGHDDRRTGPLDAADLGQVGEQPVVERDRRPEAEPLLGVDLGTMPAGVSSAITRPSRKTATRSASRSASSMRWVTRRTVTPRSRIDSMSSPRLAAGVRIEAGRQLVEDGDPRPPDEREGDREALLLAARQVAIRGVALVGETEVVEQRASGPPDRRRTRRTGRAPRATVIRSGSSLSWSWTPTRRPQAVAVAAGDRSPRTRMRAGVRRPQTGDGLDGGRLAGAVRAEDAEDLALLDGERHAVDADAVAVALLEVGDFDDVHASQPARLWH